MTKTAALLSLLLITSTSSAAVYKWKDAEGRVHYSDRPVEGAEVVKSVPLSTFKSPPAASSAAPGDTREGGQNAVNYTNFTFVSPANDTTVRDNAGNLAIQLSLDPPLRQGHSIVLTINGNRLPNKIQATTFSLSNMDRGTHTLQAAIVDNEGETVMETAATTVHMKRASILFPGAKNP